MTAYRRTSRAGGNNERPMGRARRCHCRDASCRIARRPLRSSVAAADLPRLGDPFFQAKGSYDRAYEGTGLGLSVVRGLVGLHGGRLTVESAPGVGTRVSVRLPVGGVAQASEPAKIVTFARAPRRGFETKEPYRLTA